MFGISPFEFPQPKGSILGPAPFLGTGFDEMLLTQFWPKVWLGGLTVDGRLLASAARYAIPAKISWIRSRLDDIYDFLASTTMSKNLTFLVSKPL